MSKQTWQSSDCHFLYIYPMKYLGIIYTEQKKDAESRLLNFIKVAGLDEYENTGIPSLVVGKDNAIGIFTKEKVKFLDKRIDDNTLWTFSKREHRNIYETDIEEFQKNIFAKLCQNIIYEYVDIFSTPFSVISRLLKILEGDSIKVIYICDKVLYICIGGESKIYGFSLNDADFVGVMPDKIIKLIKMSKNVVLVNNNSFLNEKTEKYVENKKYIVPFLYFHSL